MKVYLSLGTNLGDKEQNLKMAVQQIEERIGHVCALSALYVTAPWGFESSNSFLNAALCVETLFTPLEVLRITKEIEYHLGRLTKSVNGIYRDRLIDIDLLFCDEIVMNTDELVLPHPHLHQRDFVLEPLAEIAPELVHPLLNLTINEILLNYQQNNGSY